MSTNSNLNFIFTVPLSDRVRVTGDAKEVRQKLAQLPLHDSWTFEIGTVAVSQSAECKDISYNLSIENIARGLDNTIVAKAELSEGVANHAGFLEYLARHGEGLKGLNILQDSSVEISYQGFDMLINTDGTIILALNPDKLEDRDVKESWESELIDRIGWAARYYMLASEPNKYKYHSFEHNFRIPKPKES